MTHDELVRRAIAWLRSKRHDPVLAGIASCDEIPDAIGWTSGHSTVVECKTSRSDFLCDKWKYVGYKSNISGYVLRAKTPHQRDAYEKSGYVKVAIPRMGMYRYFMSEPGFITPSMITAEHPDHGLLHVQKRGVTVVMQAPKRSLDMVGQSSEIRYLRFAIVHLRDNLGRRGITCDLLKSTLYFGTDGIKIGPYARAEAD